MGSLGYMGEVKGVDGVSLCLVEEVVKEKKKVRQAVLESERTKVGQLQERRLRI